MLTYAECNMDVWAGLKVTPVEELGNNIMRVDGASGRI